MAELSGLILLVRSEWHTRNIANDSVRGERLSVGYIYCIMESPVLLLDLIGTSSVSLEVRRLG